MVGQIKTENGGVIYLKQQSYGNYDGSQWGPASPYWKTLPSGLGYAYLTSFALQNSGQMYDYAQIKDLQLYMLPYYMMPYSGEYEYQISDISYIGAKTSFTVPYYSIPAMPNGYDIYMGYLGENTAYEREYSEYVHQMYLTLDVQTLAYMQGVIAEQGFDASDPGIVYAVAKYIQNAAEYDLKYDRALDDEPNVAIAFLETYQSGVCVHYASAATLLYRALGIPARYTEGFMVETKAGEFVDIKTPGHAWVEVYIDGLGWVQVEVTGAMEQEPGPVGSMGDGNEEISKKPTSGIPGLGYVRIYSDISASYYLRSAVSGEYTGSGFKAAPIYKGEINPMLLAGLALQNSGHVSHTIAIDGVSSPFIGYYVVSGLNPGSNDPTMVDGNVYYYDIINTDYGTFMSGVSMPAQWTAEEERYYEFVKANYLQIPDSTKEALLQIAAENGLSADDPNIISDVLDFVKNAAPYDLDFAPFPEDCDIAVYFLTEAESGICQHYATSATMLYRALGIPARYVTGYVPTSVAGEWHRQCTRLCCLSTDIQPCIAIHHRQTRLCLLHVAHLARQIAVRR